MNGDIFLWHQPPTRVKKAIVLSVDDPGANLHAVLEGPRHDGDGIYSLLHEAGYASEDIVRLHNFDKQALADLMETICASLSQKESYGAGIQSLFELLALRVGSQSVDQVSLSKNTLLLLFYSGHGVTLGGRKYLIPTMGDQSLASDDDLAERAIDLESLEKHISKMLSSFDSDTRHAFPVFSVNSR